MLIIAAPINAPAGFPIPPFNETPPITDAAIEFIGQLSPNVDCAEPSLQTYNNPANDDIKPTAT